MISTAFLFGDYCFLETRSSKKVKQRHRRKSNKNSGAHSEIIFRDSIDSDDESLSIETSKGRVGSKVLIGCSISSTAHRIKILLLYVTIFFQTKKMNCLPFQFTGKKRTSRMDVELNTKTNHLGKRKEFQCDSDSYPDRLSVDESIHAKRR